jgi:hypothetical protein
MNSKSRKSSRNLLNLKSIKSSRNSMSRNSMSRNSMNRNTKDLFNNIGLKPFYAKLYYSFIK